MSLDFKTKISVQYISGKKYPDSSPYNPSKEFPEYPFDDKGFDEENEIYSAVRDLFLDLGFDKKNYNTESWNPLGKIILPGNKVVIKPNFVSEPRNSNSDPFAIITHASVIRPIIDYCLIALKPNFE